MKRLIFTLLILIMIIFSGCSATQDTSTTEDTAAVQPIIVKSPMTLSNTIFNGYKGENLYIRLRMVSGRYYEDWNPGANMGTLHEGRYCFEIADEFGTVLKRTDLAEFSKGTPLLFKCPFVLALKDYNGDGRLDFTLGQYANSNGNDFKIFTIDENYGIEVLPVKERDTLYISGGEGGYYSVLLQSSGKDTIAFQYYDQSKGKYIENTYQWTTHKAFEFVKREKRAGNGE